MKKLFGYETTVCVRACVNPAAVHAGVPRHVDTQRIREDLLQLEDVQSVDELNVWALTTDKTAALVHLQLGEYVWLKVRTFDLMSVHGASIPFVVKEL